MTMLLHILSDHIVSVHFTLRSCDRRPSEPNQTVSLMRSGLSRPVAHVKLVKPKQEPESDDDPMSEYKQRLLNDPNYTDNDYQLDYIRRKILKIPPKVEPSLATQTPNGAGIGDGDSQRNDDTFDLDKDFYQSFSFKFY